MRYVVIGTFYRRYENSLPLMKRIFVDATRKPDQVLLMCEEIEDVRSLMNAHKILYDLELMESDPLNMFIRLCPTPKWDGGGYKVIPYAHKINEALRETTCDAVVYLDNNSDPKPEKYQTMVEGLETHPEWGAVYCTQKRTGMSEVTHTADEVVEDGYCKLNYTQVMHRKTDDRWPLDMTLADPDLADGVFWRQLHTSLGPFHPVGGSMVLDEHDIPHPYAAGLKGE